MASRFGHGLSSTKPQVNFDDLPEAERENLLNHNMELAKRMGYKPDKPQTVSVVKHEEEVNALKEQIEDLKSKLEEARKDRDGLRQERDSYMERFDSKRNELSAVQEELERTRKELHSVSGELQELKRKPRTSPGADAAELAEVRKECRKLEKARSDAEADASGLSMKLDDAESEIAELKKANTALEEENVELKNSLLQFQEPDLPDMEDMGTVTMPGPASLQSDLFTARRYSVRLARDMTYMKFRPDAEGLVVCEDGVMTIPRLPDYVQYAEGREFRAYGIDGTFMIRL